MIGCILALLSLVTPRLVIILLVIFSDYIGRAYDTVLWPVLGFVFMPVTTLAYAWAINSGGVEGWRVAVLVLAVLLDLGLLGGGAKKSHKAFIDARAHK